MATTGHDNEHLPHGRHPSPGRRPAAKNGRRSTGAAHPTEEPLDVAVLLSALTALRRGDLSVRLPVDRTGTTGKIYDAFNEVTDLAQELLRELVRISHAVGKEGRTDERIQLPGARGHWAAAVTAANDLLDDVVRPTAEAARVIAAVARGDLSSTMSLEIEGRPLQGQFLRSARVVNTLVEQLSTFAAEVTRVAREVGTEGKLGGQARVAGVSGAWKELTDSVNEMAANLTAQVRNIAEVTTAVAHGDLTRKIAVDVSGELLELKNTINTMVDQLASFASEVTRLAHEVGTEWKLGGQAVVKGVSGTWKDLADNVNAMAANFTSQVRSLAEVTTAVARGDLSKKFTAPARGELLELKDTMNTMVDQLSSFASEVTRVAREVSVEGNLGGQAQVKGVSGVWRDLTLNVNSMASNLTSQVRGIATVVTSVANGDLKRKLSLNAKGEIAALAETINGMIDTLATFAEQVTTVAREVGVEGKLGGQAKVPGAAGTWRALTDNVNQLAANLTTQVRAIAEVATAVTRGDLTRSISLDAQGEMASLKDNINQMIANLRATIQKNEEQDWLKTNIARFSRMLQGQRNLQAVSSMVLRELAPLVRAQHGVFYLLASQGDAQVLKLLATYAYRERKHLANQFRPGEGLLGQCVLEKERILLTDVPADYVRIGSGLGEATPMNVVVIPVLFEGAVKAVIELASLYSFKDIHLAFLDQLTESIGIVLNTIEASMRTEELLTQSTSLAEELKVQQAELTETNKRLESQARTLQASEERLKQQQEELQQTNEELEERSRLLQLQNEEVERKNAEIESAKRSLEEKAEQLALTSRYKSEFLANMSHELRTPLNSLLILSKLLSDNSDGNLSLQQVEFAQTIHGAGSDLLSLINDILDLSKIESGTMAVDVEELAFGALQEYVERTFREVANDRKLSFGVELDPELAPTLNTDGRRLQQVLKNLLSNAFKFTEQGRVKLRVAPAQRGWSPGHPILDPAGRAIAFAVEDTGIGIPREKQQIIFEPFQQADGTTTRKYGGTGLGLSISREIARLLGGEIVVSSEVGKGSTFTLYLPEKYVQPAQPRSPSPPIPPPPQGSRAELEATQVLTRTLGTVPSALEALEPLDPALLAIDELQDDRRAIHPGDRVLLIIEDDAVFARLLMGMARENGFKALVALRGDVGLALALEHKPDAITLDMGLPVIDGWTLLDRLKHEPRTRHIPVHIISASDEERQRGLSAGAIAVIRKPVSQDELRDALQRVKSFVERPLKYLLVIEDDPAQRQSIMALIGNGDVQTTAVGSGAEALQALKDTHFDCVVMDLGLPDMSGADLLSRMKQQVPRELPVIIYTGKELSEQEELALKRFTDSIIIKSAKSPEHLLDETALFLHRVESNLPEAKRKMIKQAQLTDPVLAGRKVLVVDDDVRNIFALTSVLERANMQVLFAENGRKGMDLIRSTPDLSVVLMDVMMPEMDGYETMRAIRADPSFRGLPVIALTAKAMKGDRERCIDAGASDYITKPVDSDQLLSLLRVWVYQRGAGAAARV